LRETAREAAVRELREEVGILVRADELREVDNRVHAHNGKLDHVVIFDLELAMRPKVVVDNREIVAATFYPPDEALALPLFPPIRDVIEAKVA
jgi:8-oxo-dGTP pyrophosphatase MutT (NUDIX family)